MSSFTLPARPVLEQFFREYVIEPNVDRDRYTALKVQMPNGVLLFGPPRSAKTHTVNKLSSALGWPAFRIELGAVGSPFIPKRPSPFATHSTKPSGRYPH